MKKRILLFLALVIPGLVFVFLKYFGANRFDIPVYYADSLKVSAPCTAMLRAPYVLPDSVWELVPARQGANVAVLDPEGMDPQLPEAIRAEIGEGIAWVNWYRAVPEALALDRWRVCVFLADTVRQTVLFDREGRIRGYYDLKNLDEIDRLRVELKILLEQY